MFLFNWDMIEILPVAIVYMFLFIFLILKQLFEKQTSNKAKAHENML